MRVIGVYSIKGGVGKTALAVNLAYLSAESGARTLLWDLDPQGSATFYFRIQSGIGVGLDKLIAGKRPLDQLAHATDYEGLDLLPADFSYRNLDLSLKSAKKPKSRLKRLIGGLARHYDHVYLDCAPSISLVSEGIFRAADLLLVPTIPTTLSLRALDQLEQHLAKQASTVDLVPCFSLVDLRKSLHREIVETHGGAGSRFLETCVPYSSEIERMGVHRAPVAAYKPGSAVDVAYRRLWQELMQRTRTWLAWIHPAKSLRALKSTRSTRSSTSAFSRPSRILTRFVRNPRRDRSS